MQRIQFLNPWGTIAFSDMQMRKLIGFGVPIMNGCEFIGWNVSANPCQLDFSVWLSFVPDVYRAQCIDICRRVAAEFHYRMIKDQTHEEIIVAVQRRIWREVEPVAIE